MRFEVGLESFEKVNPLFSKAKVRILYTGVNRNNSYLDKQTVEKAIPSLYNVPIVGEFLEDKDNFGGHGGKLEITETDIKYVQTTKPYGVVAESADVYWEEVISENGDKRDYLIIDGAYLWTGRYEELNDLLENSYGQSMEIEVQNGDFSVIDGNEVFKINDFLFSALCILGINKDGEGHVEPCFEDASIVAYSLDKDDFKTQFNQMVAELKFSLGKGGKQMPEETAEQTVEEIVESTEDKFEEQEVTVNEVEEVVEEVTEEQEELAEEVVEEVVDYQSKFNDLEKEFVSLKESFGVLESEITELRKFKSDKLAEERSAAEEELFGRFESELTVEEIQAVKETSAEFTLEQIEEKLFTLVGKKKFNFSSKKKDSEVNKVMIDFSHEEETNDPYGGLFKKFGK